MAAWIMTVALATFGADRPVEFISHRGESADAPENTMAAFRLAWQRKVNSIELDVHLTRDGQLVVCHDASTRRTAGTEKRIKESTLDELRNLDVGKWKSEAFAGETIPTLDAVLSQLPAEGRCFIEIKVGPEAVPALVRSVRSSGKPSHQLAVISFQADTIAEAKRRLPEMKAYYVSGFKRDKATGHWSPSPRELIAEAQRIRADGIDVSYEGPVDESFVREAREAGLEFYVWTVDDPIVARRMIQLGVHGITSNRADWLRSQLRSP